MDVVPIMGVDDPVDFNEYHTYTFGAEKQKKIAVSLLGT